MTAALVFSAVTLITALRPNMITAMAWCWAAIWCFIFNLSGG